jgi:hypothetical protein
MHTSCCQDNQKEGDNMKDLDIKECTIVGYRLKAGL